LLVIGGFFGKMGGGLRPPDILSNFLRSLGKKDKLSWREPQQAKSAKKGKNKGHASGD